MGWVGWPFARIALLLVGLAYLMLWIQVFLFHLGGAFSKWQMWGPVLYGPVLILTSVLLAIVMNPTLAIIGYIIFGIGLIEGLDGARYHFSAIGHYVLGYRLRNFIEGPPPMLPITYAVLSLFAIVAIAWHQYVR